MKHILREIKYWIGYLKALVFGTPQVSEYSFEVMTRQNISPYDVLISDQLGRSIVLPIGAIICSMKLPRDGWQDIHQKIRPGARVTVRVLTKNIEEFQSNQIPAINAVSLVRIS